MLLFDSRRNTVINMPRKEEFGRDGLEGEVGMGEIG
jgi:hypothetical protein